MSWSISGSLLRVGEPGHKGLCTEGRRGLRIPLPPALRERLGEGIKMNSSTSSEHMAVEAVISSPHLTFSPGERLSIFSPTGLRDAAAARRLLRPNGWIVEIERTYSARPEEAPVAGAVSKGVFPFIDTLTCGRG